MLQNSETTLNIQAGAQAEPGASVNLKDIRLSMPAFDPSANFDKAKFSLGGKMIPLNMTPSFFGTEMETRRDDISDIPGLYLEFFSALAAKPILTASFADSKNGASAVLDASLTDLGMLAKQVDGQALARACTTCWP